MSYVMVLFETSRDLLGSRKKENKQANEIIYKKYKFRKIDSNVLTPRQTGCNPEDGISPVWKNDKKITLGFSLFLPPLFIFCHQFN